MAERFRFAYAGAVGTEGAGGVWGGCDERPPRGRKFLILKGYTVDFQGIFREYQQSVLSTLKARGFHPISPPVARRIKV